MDTTLGSDFDSLGASATLAIEGRLIEDGGGARVTVRDGIVAEIVRLDDPPNANYIAPGWIDLQINGFANHDPNAGDVDAGVVVAMVKPGSTDEPRLRGAETTNQEPI